MDIRLAWHCSGIFWAVFAVIEKAVFKRSACCADHIVTDNTAISTHFSLVNLKITHTGPHTPPPKKTKQQKNPNNPTKNPNPNLGFCGFSFPVVFWNLNMNISSRRKLLFLYVGLIDFFFLCSEVFLCLSYLKQRRNFCVLTFAQEKTLLSAIPEFELCFLGIIQNCWFSAKDFRKNIV